MAKAVSDEPIEDPDALFEQLVSSLHTRHPEADEEPIRRAYAVAKQAHAGQFRQTGDPYISHPIAVAQILADYALDPPTIAAALMHDVVEDTSVTLEDLDADFGSEIAMLIDGVTKLDRIKTSTWEERQAGTIRKMAVAMAKDIRVLLIKLADRIHNMRTVAPLPEEKRRREIGRAHV